MLRTDRSMIVAVLLLLPVMLCFIGVGAFLHVVVRAEAEQEEQTREQVEQDIEADKARAEKLKAAIEQREREIEEIRGRLAELEEAEARQAELARLQELKDQLEKERQALLSELEALKARSDSKDEAGESLRQQEDEARRKLEALEKDIAQLNRKIGQMVPSPTPGGEPPESGPSLAELQAAIAQMREELNAIERQREQAETELDGLVQPPRDDPGIKVDDLRTKGDWSVPPNPLYVECDRRGGVLQPENSRLPARPGQAAEDQFVRVARERGYVLFLIRPDGFDSFRRYRSLLRQNDIDFGYEPISQNGRVTYPARR